MSYRRFDVWDHINQDESDAISVEAWDAEEAAGEWAEKAWPQRDYDSMEGVEVSVRDSADGKVTKCSITVDWSPVFGGSEIYEDEPQSSQAKAGEGTK